MTGWLCEQLEKTRAVKNVDMTANATVGMAVVKS